jgi:hypothetical protein
MVLDFERDFNGSSNVVKLLEGPSESGVSFTFLCAPFGCIPTDTHWSYSTLSTHLEVRGIGLLFPLYL